MVSNSGWKWLMMVRRLMKSEGISSASGTGRSDLQPVNGKNWWLWMGWLIMVNNDGEWWLIMHNVCPSKWWADLGGCCTPKNPKNYVGHIKFSAWEIGHIPSHASAPAKTAQTLSTLLPQPKNPRTNTKRKNSSVDHSPIVLLGGDL